MLDDPEHLKASVLEQYRDVVLEIGEEWTSKRATGDHWKLATVDLYGALNATAENGGMERLFKYVTVSRFFFSTKPRRGPRADILVMGCISPQQDTMFSGQRLIESFTLT
jgi:hypothetical protein